MSQPDAGQLELDLSSEIPEEDSAYFRPADRGDTARNVKGQIAAIQNKVAQGNLESARSFTRDLITDQLERREPHYAARTLCNLAQTAKQYGYGSLQIEWVEAATRVAPQDAWAWGQAGDAYLSLFRFYEAEAAFFQAVKTGDPLYGNIGLGKIYYQTGRFVEAENHFLSATREFGEPEIVARAWIGLGESIADQLAWERSRAVFVKARSTFPYDTRIIAAFAGVLRTAGEFGEAEALFREGLDQDEVSVSCGVGLAEMLKSAGRFAEAVELYDKLYALAPGNAVIFCGRADVFHDWGNLDRAQEEYQRAILMFPHDPSGFSGLAETLKNLGRVAEAGEFYETAAERFWYDPYIRNGRANLLSTRRDFKAALAAYDENIRDFPQNFVSHAGRAEMLKRLYMFEEALMALHQVEALKPSFVKAKYYRAQIYVMLGRFDDALALVAIDHPRNYAEWLAYHVKGMALLRKGQAQSAAIVFETGLVRLPFAALKQGFLNALAFCYIVEQKFQQAERTASGTNDAVAKVIEFHAYVAQGKLKSKEKLSDIVKTGDEEVVDFAQILAAKFGVQGQASHTNNEAIDRRLTDLILARVA